jgi:predicted nucleic acid-binding protein
MSANRLEKRFFDTTILIYTLSEGDRRALVAEELLALGGWISVQVLNEFVAVGRRKLGLSWNEIREALGAIRILCEPPVSLGVEIHEKAIAISERYKYQIYDALVIAAALHTNCSVLYSEDMQDGQKIETLTIRNPFSAA